MPTTESNQFLKESFSDAVRNGEGEGERYLVVFARHGNKSRKGHVEQKMMHNALSQFRRQKTQPY
jgi:hypothetical protein